MTVSIVAIVPMRHESERVPGKNYRMMAGRPLYHHIISSLQACPQISDIIIDTDSPTIVSDARQHFPDVTMLVRPEHLRAGGIAMNDVLLNVIRQIDADYYFQTHSTNPLLRPVTISSAIDTFLDNIPMYDSLFGVTRLQTRLWNSLAMPVNHNPAILLRTQDLPPIYEENSNMYVFSRDTLENRHNRIGERPLMFEIDAIEARDIDEELDFRMAEFLYLERTKAPE